MHLEKTEFSVADMPQIAQRIESFCLKAEDRVPVLKTLWGGWNRTLREIQEKASQEVPRSRVAVIGSIKSGKSTFVNALVRSDILRRGAGTLTSAVTRVMPAQASSASIDWKGWQKVNTEAGYAAQLLSGMTGSETLPASLDLRREEDREAVGRLLESIGPTPAGLPRYALNQLARLQGLFQGYPRISAHMQDESTTMVLEREWFLQHREIVSSDAAAAYVDDVRVEFPFPEGLPMTEIADCQGSDSLNPSHIDHVQDYLLRTDWAIYLINSVMGLREADEKLLEVVQGLGLGDNILFVLNTDVDAHAGIEDLRRVQDSVEKWIASRLGPPRLYTANVLMELFKGLEARSLLSEREKERLDHWRKDSVMLEVLDSRWKDLLTFWRDEIAPAAGRFQQTFAKRSLGNLSGRLRQSVRIAANPYGLDLAALEVCSVEAEKLLPNMESHLEGAAMKAEKKVRSVLDSLLDPGFSPAGKGIKEFIQGYKSEWDPVSTVRTGGEVNITGMALSLAEEFNQSLHLFLVENVNTEITREVHKLIKDIQKDFSTVADMYLVVLNNNYLKLRQSHQPVTSSGKGEDALSADASPGIPGEEEGPGMQGMDVRELAKDPPVDLFSMKMDLSLRQKAVAVVRQGWMLSFKRAKGWIVSHLSDRPAEDENAVKAEVRLHWREKTVKSLKKEARNLVKQEMGRYNENLKYQVLIKYVHDLARACREDLKSRVTAFQQDVEQAQKAPGLSDREVVAARENLPEWEAGLKEIDASIRA